MILTLFFLLVIHDEFGLTVTTYLSKACLKFNIAMYLLHTDVT